MVKIINLKIEIIIDFNLLLLMDIKKDILKREILEDCFNIHINMVCSKILPKYYSLMTLLKIDQDQKIVYDFLENICKNNCIKFQYGVQYSTNICDKIFSMLEQYNIDIENILYIARFIIHTELFLVRFEKLLGNKKINISYFKPEIENWKIVTLDDQYKMCMFDYHESYYINGYLLHFTQK
jgi:hypothetical protein